MNFPSAPDAAPEWFKIWLSAAQAQTARVSAVGRPVLLPTFTVANLPDPYKWVQCAIYVSDGTSNKRLAVSNGSVWKFPDGNTVS